MAETEIERDERIGDLIGYAANQNPVEFQQTFNDIVADRLVQAIDARKQELAQNIFNDVPDEVETPDEQEVDEVDPVDDEPEEEEPDDEVA